MSEINELITKAAKKALEQGLIHQNLAARTVEKLKNALT